MRSAPARSSTQPTGVEGHPHRSGGRSTRRPRTSVGRLPDVAAIAELHDVLSRLRTLDGQIASGELIGLRATTPEVLQAEPHDRYRIATDLGVSPRGLFRAGRRNAGDGATQGVLSRHCRGHGRTLLEHAVHEGSEHRREYTAGPSARCEPSGHIFAKRRAPNDAKCR